MWTRGRPAALAVLSVAFGVLTWGGARAYRSHTRRALFRPPFSAAGAAAVAPDGTTVTLEPGDSSAVVLLYVSWSCVHCDAEMRRWSEVLDQGPGREGLRVRVVAADPPPPGRRLPSAIATRVLLDVGRSTARALGVTVVPTTAYVRGATVVAVVRGETSVREIRRRVGRWLGRETEGDHGGGGTGRGRTGIGRPPGAPRAGTPGSGVRGDP